MRVTTKVTLSIRGERVEKGTEIELSEEELAVLDPEDVTLVGEPEPEPEEAPEPKLEEMSHVQLQAKAESLGLSKSGSKADLQERITLHLQGTAGDSAGGTEGSDGNSGTAGDSAGGTED